MIAKLRNLYEDLEYRRYALIEELELCSNAVLRFRPGPDRWSILMVVEHMIMGERGVRLEGAEILGEQIEADPQSEKLFKMVIEILDKDVPVDVPDPSIEPVGNKDLPDLLKLWDTEREKLGNLLETVTPADVGKVVARHTVTGPLDPVRTLELALAHFEAHHRQIRRILKDKKSGAAINP